MTDDLTIRAIIRATQRAGANVTTFVRKPSQMVAPAIMVVFLDRESLRELGPMLEAFARQSGHDKPKDWLDIGPDTPARFAFEWMEKESLRWCYAALWREELRITIVCFVGDLCGEIAEALTRNGVPTSLE